MWHFVPNLNFFKANQEATFRVLSNILQLTKDQTTHVTSDPVTGTRRVRVETEGRQPLGPNHRHRPQHRLPTQKLGVGPLMGTGGPWTSWHRSEDYWGSSAGHVKPALAQLQKVLKEQGGLATRGASWQAAGTAGLAGHYLPPRPEEGTWSRRTPPASDTRAQALSASHTSLGPKDAGTHSRAPIAGRAHGGRSWGTPTRKPLLCPRQPCLHSSRRASTGPLSPAHPSNPICYLQSPPHSPGHLPDLARALEIRGKPQFLLPDHSPESPHRGTPRARVHCRRPRAMTAVLGPVTRRACPLGPPGPHLPRRHQ